MKTAIYARQSLDKVDSASIEAQIDICKKICEINGYEFEIYTDKGFSGGSLQRPAFEKLIRDIDNKKINRVIAYRLDRISRNIKDFAELIESFESKNISFISATEQFDTSSPIGRALVYIIMTFAQLERETIIKRIKDNTLFRGRSGFFTGGKAPFGYRATRKLINGKNAYMIEIDPTQSDIVHRIYDLYLKGYTTTTIVKLFNKEKVYNKQWSKDTVDHIIKRPNYTFNTVKVYKYLSSKGYPIFNDISEFDGTKGLYHFGKETKKGKKRTLTKIEEQYIVIGDFIPLIPDNIWLQAQSIREGNRYNRNSESTSLTYLPKLIRCSKCGSSIGIKADGKYKYFMCRGKRFLGICGNSTHYNPDEVLGAITNKIIEHVKTLKLDNPKEPEFNAEKNQIEMQLSKIDIEISNIVSSISSGNTVMNKYLNERISELDLKKKELSDKIAEIELKDTVKYANSEAVKALLAIDDFENTFIQMSNDEKKYIAKLLIEKVTLSPEKEIEIYWAF